ncbi:hypothetical protein F5Y16DRAFT_420417 [Xylariaceae sp. FL0255]|nr:hypothetical protein F5Y16DRAFT_420417 [Xylariaceae sp. FL0255]
MGEIYAKAHKVYAWLGPVERSQPNSSTEDLFKHLAVLGTLFWQKAGIDAQRLNECSLDLDGILAKSLEALYETFSKPTVEKGGFPTEEYSSLSTRPYWSRIWVLQEVFLAKGLHYTCGRCQLSSKELGGALILLEIFQKYLIRSQGDSGGDNITAHGDLAHPAIHHVFFARGRSLGRVRNIGRLWYPRAQQGLPSSSATDPKILHERSQSYDELLAYLREFEELAAEATKIHEASSDRNIPRPLDSGESVWRKPCYDQFVIESRLVRTDPSIFSRYQGTIRGLPTGVEGTGPDLPHSSRPYVEALLCWVNKRPFLTTTGFLGLGPASAKAGDDIVVLEGFSASYILRQHGSYDRKQYALQGEAYVDGVMDGEGMAVGPSDLDIFHLILRKSTTHNLGVRFSF